MGYCTWGLPFGHPGWFAGHGPPGAVFGFLLLGIAALGVIVFCSLAGRARADRNRDRQDALDILRARLARGEISEEEYHHLRSVLHG